MKRKNTEAFERSEQEEDNEQQEKYPKTSESTQIETNQSKSQTITIEKKEETNKIEASTTSLSTSTEMNILAKKLYLGAHVSISGGLHKAVERAGEIQASAFAMFTGSSRGWARKPIEQKDADKFKKAFTDAGFNPNLIVPHGSYLINVASPTDETCQKSRQAMLDEVKICKSLGLTLYNFHPGSTKGEITIEEGIAKASSAINEIHKQVSEITILIENTAGSGSTLGRTFEELKGIIDKIEDKSRIGVCLDSCHVYSAGYDIKQKFETVMEDFEKIIGLKYLKAVHLNDTKTALNSRVDRHEVIGKGHLGIETFRIIMNDKRFRGIPIVLETAEPFDEQLKLLHSLVKDPENIALFKDLKTKSDGKENAKSSSNTTTTTTSTTTTKTTKTKKK